MRRPVNVSNFSEGEVHLSPSALLFLDQFDVPRRDGGVDVGAAIPLGCAQSQAATNVDLLALLEILQDSGLLIVDIEVLSLLFLAAILVHGYAENDVLASVARGFALRVGNDVADDLCILHS